MQEILWNQEILITSTIHISLSHPKSFLGESSKSVSRWADQQNPQRYLAAVPSIAPMHPPVITGIASGSQRATIHTQHLMPPCIGSLPRSAERSAGNRYGTSLLPVKLDFIKLPCLILILQTPMQQNVELHEDVYFYTWTRNNQDNSFLYFDLLINPSRTTNTIYLSLPAILLRKPSSTDLFNP